LPIAAFYAAIIFALPRAQHELFAARRLRLINLSVKPTAMEKAVVTLAIRDVEADYFRQAIMAAPTKSPRRISIGKSTLCSIGDTGTESAIPNRIWHY
jgi:hypothetical protein